MKHRLEHYTEAAEMAADIEAKNKDGWALHSWHPTVEMFEANNARFERQSWPVTVFYAMFYELPKPKELKPIGSR